MSLEPNHVDSRGDKATRTACPSLASCQRVAATGADRAIVTALEKAAARSNDVLERAAVDADLQYAAVEDFRSADEVARQPVSQRDLLSRRRGVVAADKSAFDDHDSIVHIALQKQGLAATQREGHVGEDELLPKRHGDLTQFDGSCRRC